jgi:hypothetical protein
LFTDDCIERARVMERGVLGDESYRVPARDHDPTLDLPLRFRSGLAPGTVVPDADEVELVGRAREFARVRRLLTCPPAGSRGVVITGTRGSGRSALWRAAVIWLRTQRIPVWASGVSGGRLCEPLGPLRMSRDYARLALAIDDVDLLDSAAAGLLQAATADAPVTLICTSRSGASGSWKTRDRGRLTEVRLGALEERAIADLARLRAPDVAADELHRIAFSAGGNPALACELLERADGRAGESLLASPIDEANAVHVQLESFEPHTRSLIESLATVGDLSTALRLMGNHAGTDRALESARAFGIVGSGESGFICPRYRLAVHRAIAPGRALDWNRRAAASVDDRTLARLYAGFSVDPPCESLARQLEHAAQGAPRLLAARLLARSVKLTATGRHEDRWRRRLALAVTLAQAGTVVPARVTLEDAILEASRGPWLARALLWRARLGDLASQRRRLLSDAMLVCGEHTSARAEALEALALELAHTSGDLTGAAGIARLAVAITPVARSTSIDASVALIETIRGRPPTHRTPPGRFSIPRADVREHASWAHSGATDARYVAAFSALWDGHPALAHTRFAKLARDAYAAQAPGARARALLGLAEAAQRLARLTSAKRHAKLGMRLAQDTQDFVLLARFAALSRLIDALRGIDAHQRHSPAGELEAGYLCNEHDAYTNILERWAVGLVELANGRPRTAAAALDQACLRLQEMGVARPGVYPLLPDAVAALIAADREPEAAALSRQLAEQAARTACQWPAIASMRCQALLRLSDNDTVRAIDELEQVRLDLRCLGLRLEAARTGVELEGWCEKGVLVGADGCWRSAADVPGVSRGRGW